MPFGLGETHFLFENYRKGSHRFMQWQADVILFISCDKPVDLGRSGSFWTSADVAAAALCASLLPV